MKRMEKMLANEETLCSVSGESERLESGEEEGLRGSKSPENNLRANVRVKEAWTPQDISV